jgi:uncharacterized protein
VNKESTKPLVVLLLTWGVVVFFTLYAGAQIRDELPWLEPLLTPAAETGDSIGLSNVRNGVEAVRGRVNDDYLVWVAEEEIAPPPPPPPVVAGDSKHRIAPAKRRVLVIGASSIQFALGVELERYLPTYEGVKSKRFGKLATGLARPDFFDWPKKLDELAQQFKPDLVIANYGGNCVQPIPVGDKMIEVDTGEEWDRLYGSRVKDLVDIAKKHGADFVFLGMPNMRDPKFTRKMERLNRVQRRAAEDAGAMWISVWEMTSTAKGEYLTEIEWQGERGLLRAIDGVHYRTLGARYIVDEAMQAVERRFLLSPQDQTLARAEPHSFESSAGSIDYVAFVPKTAGEANKLPVVYVVPGAEAKWSEWPNYPHRELQKLAMQHQLVLVVIDRESMGAELLAKEIVPDVEAHLPVTDRRGLLGPALSELHAGLEKLESPHTFKETPSLQELSDLVRWHAEQLKAVAAATR